MKYITEYLQDLSDVLLFLLLPTEDYNNKPFRYIIRVSIYIPSPSIAWEENTNHFISHLFCNLVNCADDDNFSQFK